MMNRPTVPGNNIQETNLLGYYAGFISRFIAFAIDILIISFSIVAATWFVSVTANAFKLGAFLGFSPDRIPWSRPILDFLTGPLVTGLVSIAFIVGYHVFFWVFAGQTPGKALLGLRLVTSSGNRLTPMRAILRFGSYIISALPLYLGFLWVLIDDRRQALHDKIAGTVVIYTWAARPDELFLKEEIQLAQGKIGQNPVSPPPEIIDTSKDS